MRIISTLFFALALLLGSSPKGYAQGAISPKTEKVQISIRGGVPTTERAAIVRIYSLSPSREISLPRIGNVKISGWGYAALSLEIQKAYRDSGIYPEIEVDV